MKKYSIILLLIAITFACKKSPTTVIPAWTPYDESEEIAENANHESVKMQFKLIQSQVMDKNDLWKNVSEQIMDFSEEEYQRLKPLILEQDIPTLQSHVASGELTIVLRLHR